MKTIFIVVFFIVSIVSNAHAYAYDGGHDSLLYDGNYQSSFENSVFKSECFWKVVIVKGVAGGTVLKKSVIKACGNDTVFSQEHKLLEENDVVLSGTEIKTGFNSQAAIAVFLAGDTKHVGAAFVYVGPSSLVTLPSLEEVCESLKLRREQLATNEKITILEGKVKYDSDLEPSPKFKTSGKRASVLHTKTQYTHEVKIDGSDTIDIIQVYKGSVEVTYIKSDVSDDEAMSVKMGKLTQDMLDGKITAEEYQAKMEEFQKYGQQNMDLSKPVTVDEGSKCTVTKNSIIVEPIGAGDEHWWEH